MFTPQRKGWSLTPRSAERNGLLLSNPRSAGGTRFEKGRSTVGGPALPQNLLEENGTDAGGSGTEVEVWKRFREAGMIDEAVLEKAGEALLERIDKLENEVSEEKDAVPMNPSGKRPETREEMLSRHRRDISELQNKEMSLKKAAARGSKAEQKAKKKQVEDEISRLSSELKDRHTKELASMGYTNNKEKGDLDNLVMAIAGVSVSSDVSKPRKSAKKREKRAQQEAQREQKIQEEQGSIISDRMIEDEKLEKKLKPHGLMINEIKPDGHCLYRAVEDQLSFHLRNSSPYSYQDLRRMAARYMREHASEFLPFFLSDTEIDTDDSMERFEKYCKEVESTAAWGGQLELGALTHCLHKHIVIFSGSFPDVEMGKEYKLESGSISSNPSVMLSYHRHAYGLGEHYNSVVPSGV